MKNFFNRSTDNQIWSQKFKQTITIIFLAWIISIGIIYIKAWVGPTSAPAAGSGAIAVDGSSNVGIGTTSPGAKLEVSGNIKLSGGSPQYTLTNLKTPIANSDAATKDYVDIEVAAAGGSTELITETNCTNAGWQWDSSQDVCVSPRVYITNRVSWNSCGTGYSIDHATCPDTLDSTGEANGSTVYVPQYTCIQTTSTDTMEERMIAFADYDNTNSCSGTGGGAVDCSADLAAPIGTWGNLIQMGNRETDNAQHKNWSALAVADCVDGVKDLGKYYKPTDGCPGGQTACSNSSYFGEYNTRNNMLAGWAGSSGSHLPMPAEYEQSCNNLTLADTGYWLWGLAIGKNSGLYWADNARWLGFSGCSDQNSNNTGSIGDASFRVFFRP